MIPHIRNLLPILLALSVGLVGAFSPPGPAERKAAAGSLMHLKPELKAAFSPSNQFNPIPKPEGFDWLSSHKEKGQTYPQFLKKPPLRPGTKGRKFIYLQPLGTFPDKAPSLETIKKFLEAYFHPMPVKLVAPIDVSGMNGIKKRQDQINATDVLDMLEKRVPKDAYIVMAVTMKDLYPGPKWNFVFGLARYRNRCGVFSFERFGSEENPELALQRALKVTAHETGHAFGIHHCVHYHCLMNGSNGMDETDRAPIHLCPVCLRKLHWSLRFSPRERYKKIESFFESISFEKETDWFEMRASALTSPAK